MSFVGKVLITAQLVLSLLFMTFAGAVYNMHQNWKAKHDAVAKERDDTRASQQAVQSELEQAKRDNETKLTEQTQRANNAQAQNAILTQQVAQLQQENGALAQQRNTQTGLAEAKAKEASFRQDEANTQLIANKKLQEALNAATSQIRDLLDQNSTQGEAMAILTERYNTLLKKSAYLERTVAANNLPTDPREIEKLQLPAPPVEGIITTVRKDRTNRPKFLMLSIGQDDGLIEGHILDVVRRTESKWLGKARVVSVGPDEAVAEVIDAAANGIIVEGDDVTTKL